MYGKPASFACKTENAETVACKMLSYSYSSQFELQYVFTGRYHEGSRIQHRIRFHLKNIILLCNGPDPVQKILTLNLYPVSILFARNESSPVDVSTRQPSRTPDTLALPAPAWSVTASKSS